MKPRLTKHDYHQLALAGARALLVEMKEKELAILEAFAELRPTMDKLAIESGRKMPSRAESAARLAWARKQPQLTAADLARRFNFKQSAATQVLMKWTKQKLLRRVSKGVYSGQKLLKAA